MRDCHCYSRGKESGETIKVNDVLLLYEENLPRHFWKFAGVIELITGKDRRHCGAVIRVSAKDGRITILRPPLQLLYPLEIKSEKPNRERNLGLMPHGEKNQPLEMIVSGTTFGPETIQTPGSKGSQRLDKHLFN